VSHRSVLTYINLQEEFCKTSFSVDALRNSTSFYDFISRIPKSSERDAVYNKLLKFSTKINLSVQNSRELMDLIKAFKPQISVPSDIRVTKRFLLRRCKFMLTNLMKKTVEWPSDWNMSTYTQLGGVPNCVKIIAIDPYEVVAYKFCDPVLQFLYQDHIKYNYFATDLEDGTDC
jgi:hypothetical protein